MSSIARRKLPKITDFPPEKVTPAVVMLLEIRHQQQAEIQALRDEIARLKGGNPKPPIKPSKLDSAQAASKKKDQGKHRGKNKRSKTHRLEIHEEITVAPPVALPAGSRFKGYDEFTVQDLRIEARHTRYRLERWVSPHGETLRGERPAALEGGHFGPTLRAFILHQYHHGHVTQPLLLEQLGEWGIEISAGQLNRLITQPAEAFHAEKEALLRAGGAIVALLGFGAAAWKCQARDAFIGWSSGQRERALHLLINNARLLILPWVRCPNLAAAILARAARRIGEDFLQRHGYRPVLLETFVEQPRFRGTAYQAAN